MSINVNDKNLGHATAYAYYKAGGGTMTEAEFTEFMADFGTASQTAVEAAQAALASKNAAQTAATTATNKATEATTAATTATTKAGEASTSASTATSAKDTAVSASQTATSKATEATTAAATATSAKTDAVAANTAAQSAKTAAQTAQTGAETAAASVSASAEQIATNAADISQLKSDFADMQSDGVVPSAEQILTDKGVTDSVPYHYRKTGGDGADRLYDQIVGGTVCFNQLVKNGNFADTSNWTSARVTLSTLDNVGTITVTEATNPYINQSFASVAGHKYLYMIDAKRLSGSGVIQLQAFYNGIANVSNYNLTNANWETLAKIVDNSIADNNLLRIGEVSSIAVDDSFAVRNAQVFDLTQMFGSTIADHIYSLEQATEGAGVAFFKSLFPNDYYPYNSGELVSVSGLSEHKMVGFNQWDEESEDGTWNNTTGAPVEAIASRRNKNPISVVPNTSYYTNKVFYRYFYDSDMTLLSYDPSGTNQFTTPANARYMNIKQSKADWDGTNTNINLSDPAKNGTYEPHKAHSYPLDSTLTLRGIPKLDANNQLYYDGDTYDADGTVTRKYGVVDLGTLNYTKIAVSGDGYYFLSEIMPTLKKQGGNYDVWSNLIIGGNYDKVASATIVTGTANDKTYGGYDGGAIRFKNDAYSDEASFKASLSGVYLVYELATPTAEEADPYQHLQQCDPNGTEEYVSTGIVPVGHNSFYPENLKAKIEGLPWNFANLIAPTESTFVATRNYVTGALFIVDNVLYKATSNIANGGTITPNTNCTATTLAEIISALA